MQAGTVADGNMSGAPTFGEALRFWVKLGFVSFGGPAGQIAMMHRELVDRRRWVDERRFMDGLNFCMMLPGPEAQQLATYLGWRMHGTRGGLAAGIMFVLPSAVMLYALAWLVMAGGEIPLLAAVFRGLMAAVIAVIAHAVLRIGRNALGTPARMAVAAGAFAAIFGFGVSFVVIVGTAAMIGAATGRLRPGWFGGGHGHAANPGGANGGGFPALPPMPRATMRRAVKITAICVSLWVLPWLALAAWLGWHSTPVQQGVFFSKAAMVTFGGAYAVLPYVAQQAVESHGWLSHPQMMTGLALAETTPGPLIMVLQFVGFVGGWQHPGGLPPMAAATIGALVTTWVTFVPCFWFIFMGGPFIERSGRHPRIAAALAAVTAAVVGVILNLGVIFATHALWPETGSFDWPVAVLAVAAFVALARFKAGLIPVIITCATIGALIGG